MKFLNFSCSLLRFSECANFTYLAFFWFPLRKQRVVILQSSVLGIKIRRANIALPCSGFQFLIISGLIAERALLERRLEEAHIHLAEIKTSWSDKIAILETQVSDIMVFSKYSPRELLFILLNLYIFRRLAV